MGSAALLSCLFVGIVMTLVGFAFKIAAAPFHLWAPDAYQGAPVPSAAFIASGSKVASFVVLGKIVLTGFGPLHGSAAWQAMIAGWAPVLAALAALSIVIGNLVALAQSNVRRLLAYSAVAHAGYTLLGLVAGGAVGRHLGHELRGAVHLVVLGEFNHGKSTFINALLAEPVDPAVEAERLGLDDQLDEPLVGRIREDGDAELQTHPATAGSKPRIIVD